MISQLAETLKKPRQCRAFSFFTDMNLRENVHAISKTAAAKRYNQDIILFYNAYIADSVPCATVSVTRRFFSFTGPASPSLRAQAIPPNVHFASRNRDR